jgi:hypothetical protein
MIYSTTCHLFNIETYPRALKLLETIEQSYHFSLNLFQCENCGQIFVYTFVELWDDSWSFWAPISLEEVQQIKENHNMASKIIESRKHVVDPPPWKNNGKLYWSEEEEPALHFGPRGW